MAPLNQDRTTDYSPGDLQSIPVAGGEQIFSGSLVISNAYGYGKPGADGGEGCIFEGVAVEGVDNRNGDDGDVAVVVRRRGRYHFDCASPVDQAAMSGEVCVKDDQTVADDSDVVNAIPCGRICIICADGSVWIDIDHYTQIGKDWTPPVTTAAPTTTTTTQGGV